MADMAIRTHYGVHGDRKSPKKQVDHKKKESRKHKMK